jgi:hypothetical protein
MTRKSPETGKINPFADSTPRSLSSQDKEGTEISNTQAWSDPFGPPPEPVRTLRDALMVAVDYAHYELNDDNHPGGPEDRSNDDLEPAALLVLGVAAARRPLQPILPAGVAAGLAEALARAAWIDLRSDQALPPAATPQAPQAGAPADPRLRPLRSVTGKMTREPWRPLARAVRIAFERVRNLGSFDDDFPADISEAEFDSRFRDLFLERGRVVAFDVFEAMLSHYIATKVAAAIAMVAWLVRPR